MALNAVALSAGDQGNAAAQRFFRGDLSQSALALAVVSGDSFLVARPEPLLPQAREAVQPRVPVVVRRAPGGRSRSRPARFSPYPVPRFKLSLLRNVLQQHLIAFGSVAIRI
ncbi:uncharacterized protein C11orf71 homolog [Ctenodactylus gundi]